VLEACLDIVAQPGIAPDAIPADARAAVEGACQHGDADACAALGRPIAPQALCRAHDYKACTETGSAADLELACDHGSYDACNQIALAARDADPPDPHVVEKFARACKDAPHNLCDLNRPEDLVIGCAAYLPQRIPPDQRVALPAVPGPKGRPFVFLGRGAIPDDVLGAMAQRLAPAIAVYVQDHGEPQPPPPPATAVHIDAALAAAPISKLTSRADLRSVPFGQTNFVVVDGTGTPRAILSWGFGLIPATLARCVSGLLAEP
jgi:AcrR family transcriptional regulator